MSGRGKLVTNTIRTNAANLRLDGGSASFAALQLASNSGTFTITNGFNYTTPGDLSNSGLLVIGPSSTMHVAGALDNTGLIDLTGNLIVDEPFSGPESAGFNRLFTQLVTGYSNGEWNGLGIFSTTAAANRAMGIGYAPMTDEGGGMMMKLTVVGDTNLDGVLDRSDLERIASAFERTSDWATGDFNYDQMTTIHDLNLLAPNWLGGISELNEELNSLGLPAATAPEPKLGIALLLGMSLRLRRRSV